MDSRQARRELTYKGVGLGYRVSVDQLDGVLHGHHQQARHKHHKKPPKGTKMESINNDDALQLIREKLDTLIKHAPIQTKGRPPTPEEIAAQQKFKDDVKELLEGAPPDSGLSYKSVMKQVKAIQYPKPPESSQKPKEPKKPKQSPAGAKKQPGWKDYDNSPPVDYLCVLDFEAACNETGPPLDPQEIIEFPTLLVNAKTGEVEDTFHHYIKPDVHQELSPFCTELTGITQDMVDGGISLEEALILHQKWIDGHDIISEGMDPFRQSEKKRYLYVTCGDWDLKTCLTKQLEYHGKEAPDIFSGWINIKYAFVDLYKQNVRGMTEMLEKLNLELEGKHHSGIDDCKNIARICAKMLQDGWVPRATRSAKNAGSIRYWNFYKGSEWPTPDTTKPYKKVFLIRHGQSQGQVAELDDRKTNKKYEDCGLTEKGRKQAKEVAELLGPDTVNSIDLVVSSPLTRALNTAILAFPNHNIIVDYDIVEVGNGMPENMARPTKEVLEDLEADIAARGPGVTIDYESFQPKGWPRPTRKESRAKRIRSAMKDLFSREETTFAIVCHYGVVKEILVGKQGRIAAENSIPIRCLLFANGDVVLAHH